MKISRGVKNRPEIVQLREPPASRSSRPVPHSCPSLQPHISFHASRLSLCIDERIEKIFRELLGRKCERLRVKGRSLTPPTLSAGGRGARVRPAPLFCNHPLCHSPIVHLTRALSSGTVHCRIESSACLGIFRDGRWSVAIIVTFVCGNRNGAVSLPLPLATVRFHSVGNGHT